MTNTPLFRELKICLVIILKIFIQRFNKCTKEETVGVKYYKYVSNISIFAYNACLAI